MTREEILKEMYHVQRDLQAFVRARDSIQIRIVELEAEDPLRMARLNDWAGTQAAMNVLIMCIVRCEGLLEDYQKHLDALPAGTLN